MEDRMKKLLLAGTALAALAAGSANAADLARPVPVYRAPPPVVSYFTWTGCYVGGNGGGLWARKDWSNDIAIPGLGAFPAVPAGASFSSHDVNGGVGGIQGGCNYQVGSWVFGIQGDYDWTNINSNVANAIPAAVAFGLTDNAQFKSLAS